MLDRNQSSSDWIVVDNISGDGGNTSFYLEDVLLCISFSVIWKQAKPLMLFQITYGTTLLSWFEIPTASTDLALKKSELLAQQQTYVLTHFRKKYGPKRVLRSRKPSGGHK
jgi:hypothetical protein